MNIKILDCTLRDGGYVNNWKFGEHTIKSIINRLDTANVDIIEVGFLTEKDKDRDYTLFSSTDQVEGVMPKSHNSLYVGMKMCIRDRTYFSLWEMLWGIWILRESGRKWSGKPEKRSTSRKSIMKSIWTKYTPCFQKKPELLKKKGWRWK